MEEEPTCPYCKSRNLKLNEDNSGLCSDCGGSFFELEKPEEPAYIQQRKEIIAPDMKESEDSVLETLMRDNRARKKKDWTFYMMLIGGLGLIIYTFIYLIAQFMPLVWVNNPDDVDSYVLYAKLLVILLFTSLLMFISGVLFQIERLHR